MHFLVIGDEPLAKAIERQVPARTNAKVVLQQMTAEEFDMLEADQLNTDIIVYPSYLLGAMVERQLLMTVPKFTLEQEQTAQGDVLPIERRVVARFGDRDCGFSLGSPALVLLYREDLFRTLALAPPKTWAEYQTAVDKLQAWHSESAQANGPREPIWSATCEPLQSEWAAQILLARSAAYIRKYGTHSTLFDISSMEPLINQEPFQRALAELAAAVKKSSHDLRNMRPADARLAILQGECAMAITWPTKEQTNSELAASPEISLAELPGSAEVFDFSSQFWKMREDGLPLSVPLIGASGRLASVARSSQQSSSAFRLLSLLCSKELIAKISPASEHTSIPRTSQLGNATAWIGTQYSPGAAQSYARAIERWNDDQLYLQSLRIPGRQEYLQSLAAAVSRTLDGGEPQSALNETAARWREITDTHGLDKQKTAYLRSLGVKP